MTDPNKFLIIDLSSQPIEIPCYKANTTPSYMMILDNSNLLETKCYNLLHVILEKGTQNIKFKEFEESIQRDSQREIDLDLLIHIWYYQFKLVNYTEITETINVYKSQMGMDEDGAYESYINTNIIPILKAQGLSDDVTKKILLNKNKISNEIEEFMSKYQDNYNEYNGFNSLPLYDIDNQDNIQKILIEEDVYISYILTDDKLSLDIIFNYIELDDFIPFCTYNNYIKVLKDFDIEEHDWLKTNFKKMNLDEIKSECNSRNIDTKANRVELINKLIDYENENKELVNYNKDIISLKYTDEKKKIYDNITISLKNSNIVMDIKTKESKLANLLQRLYKVIKTNSFVIDDKSRRFTGKLFILNKDRDISINQYIFANLLMVEDNVFFINEFVNASTNTKTIKLQYDYNNTLQTSVQNNVIFGNEKNDIRKDYDKKRKYLQINILSCKNMNELIAYINDFSRMLQIYFDNLNNETTTFNEINTLVGKRFNLDEFDEKYKDINSSIIPDIIRKISGQEDWTRKCQKEKNQYLQVSDIDYQEGLIPIDVDEVLESFEKKFTNKLSEEDKIELKEYLFKDNNTGDIYMKWPKDGEEQYLFSCNKSVEQTGEGKKFSVPGIMSGSGKEYNNPCCFPKLNKNTISYYTGVKDDKENQNYELQTQSLLKPDGIGVIINPKILYIVGKDSQRIGVDNSNFSFLSCVYTLKDGIPTRKPTPELMKAELKNIMETSINCCLQSNYDISVEDIRRNILSNKYFDPRLYTLMLETYYKLNIITFDINGDIIISKNKYGDIFYRYDNTIFIYENMKGNDRICEGIKTLNTIRDPIRFKQKFYMNDKIIEPFVNTSPVFDRITSQYIDEYGKCRMISINYNNNTIYAYTFLPALPNIVTKDYNTGENNIKLLVDFIDDIGFIVKSQYAINNTTLEIYCIDQFYNNFYFKVNCQKLDIKKTHNVPYIINLGGTNYSTYVKNKKIATVLKQNLLWSFSQYRVDMGTFIENIDMYFYDSANYDYKFNTNLDFNNGFFQDKKLIIGSNNPTILRTRLLQYLKLFSIRFENLLSTYGNRKIISNTFENISEFKIYPKQYLTFYNNYIPKNNNNINIHHKLNSKINNNPYLYIFNNKLILAQDCSSVDSSLYISANWYTNNFNYKYCHKKLPKRYNLYDKQGRTLLFASTNSYDIIKVHNNKYISVLYF